MCLNGACAVVMQREGDHKKQAKSDRDRNRYQTKNTYGKLAICTSILVLFGVTITPFVFGYVYCAEHMFQRIEKTPSTVVALNEKSVAASPCRNAEVETKDRESTRKSTKKTCQDKRNSQR